jgi:RNA polymerase sigma factor (sigma-70 family)
MVCPDAAAGNPTVSNPATTESSPTDSQTRLAALSLSKWFEEEVQPHDAALRSYIRSRFPSVEADDVIQESYLRLLKVRARGGIKSVKAYVFTIAKNTALGVFRRRKFISDVPVNKLPDWRILDENPDAAAIANTHQQFTLAEEAIEQLPPRCRDVVRLAAFGRLSPKVIAQQLGIAESTVYVQLARGFKKCTEYLRERGELP